MITTALVVVLLTLFAYLVWKAYKVNQHWAKKGIKHLPPVLFFGNNLPMVLGTKNQQHIIQELYQTYPDEPVLGYYEFMTPRLYIRDADLIQKVLVKDFSYFTDHGVEVNVKKNPRDEQLFIVNGARWRALRAKLSPLFTSGKLKEMYDTMTSVGKNLLEYLEERKDQEIDARELMTLFSMDVISSAVFGIDPATLKNPDCEFRQVGKDMNNPTFKNIIRMTLVFAFPKLLNKLGISFMDSKIRDYYCNIIQNGFDTRKEKGIQRNDFIQMMMELKERGSVEFQSLDNSDDYLKQESEVTTEKLELTDDLLMAQALQFMVAGFEATALVMAFTMFELTQHLDAQDKICKEVAEQVKLKGGLSYEALKNMIYLESAIKETQRFHGLVPMLFRVCTKTYEFPNGYVIHKGEPAAIPISAVHMDPVNFPEPTVWKYDRFIEPVKQGTFLPFGEGPRMCIAMRYAMMVMKYGLALFFLNYKVKLSDKTTVPLKFNKRGFIPMPKEKILLKLEKL